MDDITSTSTILETNRLLLRYQRASDIPFLIDLWTDPDATRFLGGPRDRDFLASAFAEIAANPAGERYDLWPVAEKATGRLVGYCGLLDKEVDGHPEIEVSYMIAPTDWGKGYATEIGQALVEYAQVQLGLPRLIALIDPENTASAHVARKLGMRLEREVVRPGGSVRCVYAT